MDNYYQAPYYYSTSPSSSSDLPYSVSQPLQQWKQPQYFEAPPMSYEQVPTYPEYCQQYDTYYPVQNIAVHPNPVVQEERAADKINWQFEHRRGKMTYSAFQENELVIRFKKSDRIVGAERKALAKKINLSEKQIKAWFQNKRKKQKNMGVSSSSAKVEKSNAYKPY